MRNMCKDCDPSENTTCKFIALGVCPKKQQVFDHCERCRPTKHPLCTLESQIACPYCEVSIIKRIYNKIFVVANSVKASIILKLR